MAKERGLEIPWVKEQVKKGLKLGDNIDIREHLNSLTKETLAKALKELDFSNFSKEKIGNMLNSAAYIVLVQRALNVINGDTALDVDGIYKGKSQTESETQKAIKAFQTSRKLTLLDGIPGPTTAAELIKALGEVPAAPATPAPAAETPAEKVEKAKTTLSTELRKLEVTVEYSPAEKDGRVFTKNFTINSKTFNIGIGKNGKFLAFEIKNGEYFGLKNGKWEGRSDDNKGGLSDFHDLAAIINALPKPEKSTAGLEKYRDKGVQVNGTPTLTPEIYDNDPKIYFKVEGGGLVGYIRLEKADIDTPKGVTYKNITIGPKLYESITLTPSVADGKLTITVTSRLKEATQTPAPLTLETHQNRDSILASVRSIPGLNNSTLAGLGFRINNQDIVLPEGLVWTDATTKNAVKLDPKYEVNNGTIIKKSPAQDYTTRGA